MIRPFSIDDAGWVVARHGELYQKFDGFDDTFRPLVAEIVADFVKNHDPSCERGWIAEREGVRLGSIFCVKVDASMAKLRLFLVEPDTRGMGLGRLLLDSCLRFAREAGYARMRLWTHESHRAACALYQAYGFGLLSSAPVRSFGQDLVEQSWEITL